MSNEKPRIVVRPHYGTPRVACVECGETPTIIHREFDGQPRCLRCHVRVAEAARRLRQR